MSAATAQKIVVRELTPKGKHGVSVQCEDFGQTYWFYSPGNSSQSAMQHSMNLAIRDIESLLAGGATLDFDPTDFGGRVVEFQQWLKAHATE